MGARIGSLAYSCSCGLGYLARSFATAGVTTSTFVVEHPRYPTLPWYPGSPSTRLRHPDVTAITNWLAGLDVVIYWETPFLWQLPGYCRQRGIKTVLVPMREWFPASPPGKFDLYLCPSLWDLDYFQHIGRAEYIPVPVDPLTWQQRTTARRFLHNAGHLGSRHHKGTEELLKAVPLIKSPIELTIRAQTTRLSRLLNQHPQAVKDPRVKVWMGEVPYETLFTDMDALVNVEKYNGLSLPLQEARAAGMLVMTSDRYPHNTWLPQEGLVPVEHYEKVRVAPGYLEIDEAVVSPKAIAEAIDHVYGQDITAYSLASREWAWANSWQALRSRYMAALEAIL